MPEFTTYHYVVMVLSLFAIIYGILDRKFGDEYKRKQS